MTTNEPVPGYEPGLSDDLETDPNGSDPHVHHRSEAALWWWAEAFPQWKDKR